MTIPVWFAGILATALISLLVAVAGWMVKSDATRQVINAEMKAAMAHLSEKLDSVVAILDKHNPIAVAAKIDALETRATTAEANYKAHHKLIRGLQRRMDRAHFPEESTGASNGADDEP